MTSLNHSLFLLINAGANPPQWLLQIAMFFAKDLLFITFPILAAMFISPPWRPAAVKTALAIVCAVVLAALIHHIMPMPRPFVVGIGYTYLQHAPDASFPSDHGTFMFTFALAMLCWTRRWFGLCMLVAALAVAWSRVYLGVHFPLDMLGGLLLGLFSCALVHHAIKHCVAYLRDRSTQTS